MMVLDQTLKATLTERLVQLEKHFSADCAFYFGEIHPFIVKLKFLLSMGIIFL